ncbi:MAG: polysaccharide export protein, partial [Steroidobacteraceae bacterium]
AQWLISTGKGEGRLDASSGLTPVIYKLNFADPGALLTAQGLTMRDKDVLYAASHPVADLNKFLTSVVSPLLGTARSTVVLTE